MVDGEHVAGPELAAEEVDHAGQQGPPGRGAAEEADDDGEAPEEDCELYKMKVPELKKLAEDSGVKVTSTMKKNEIIEAILNA